MGVDGIGSGGRPLPRVPDAGGGELGAARGVEAEAAEGTEGALGASGTTSPLLEQLRRGEIDLDRYLDVQVNAAMSHVSGALPAAQLDFIRETLREQIASDPVLVELVRRATGSTPKARTG
ncbi:MAG TPA: hypothetical protein VHC69_05355 [Polyangiaceae bacterium]|nr:hypothetical protein [Polyangiaceae bacterium]